MGDILYKNEIDDLLEKISTGEINAQEFKRETAERRSGLTSKPSKLQKII